MPSPLLSDRRFLDASTAAVAIAPASIAAALLLRTLLIKLLAAETKSAVFSDAMLWGLPIVFKVKDSSSIKGLAKTLTVGVSSTDDPDGDNFDLVSGALSFAPLLLTEVLDFDGGLTLDFEELLILLFTILSSSLMYPVESSLEEDL